MLGDRLLTYLIDNYALTLLSDVFTSGISHSSGTSKAACIPNPKFLQIASTLLVHPISTTRAKNEDIVEVPSISITLLRNVLTEVGPKNANLKQAFSFEADRYSRRRSRDGDSSSSHSDDDDDIKGVVSQNGMWRCAKDFWQIVGWSFNCSVRYPKRWRYWKVLLEYLLDVLDADWWERKAMDVAATNAEDGSPSCKYIQDSLLAQYLGASSHNLNGTAIRRIIKSAFADGSLQSMKAYPEIFENETKDIKKNVSQKRKRYDSKDVKGKDFGDDSEEEEEELTSDTSESPEESAQKPSKKGSPTYSSTIGDPDSIHLRQRVITLVRNFLLISRSHTNFPRYPAYPHFSRKLSRPYSMFTVPSQSLPQHFLSPPFHFSSIFHEHQHFLQRCSCLFCNLHAVDIFQKMHRLLKIINIPQTIHSINKSSKPAIYHGLL